MGRVMRKCDRCGLRARDRRNAWGGRMISGVVVERVCPACQTAEEKAEADVIEATIEYGGTAFGLLTMKPKEPRA